MKKLLLILVLGLGALFVLSRLAQLDQIGATLGRGDPRWLLLAAGLQGVWLVNVALSFRSIYRLLGIEERLPHLVQLAAAANFVNVVTPSMGMGGMAVFVLDGQRRGHPGGRVSTGVALYVLYDYLGFLAVLTLGLIVLFRRNQLNTPELIASAIFTLAALVLASLMLAAMRNGDRLEQLLTRAGGWVNRLLRPLLKREYLDLERARVFAREVGEGLRQARRSRTGMLLPAALSLSSKALLVAILLLIFLAFRQPPEIGTLIAGFSLGYLFQIVSPTPSGVGFVEGAMALGLGSLGVPGAAAAIIALSYRGVTFWLPLLYGMLAFRWVGRPAPA